MSLRGILTLPAAALLALALASCGHGKATSAATAAPTIAGADLHRGMAVFAAQCAACHGEAGKGGPVGPALTDERAKRNYANVKALVADPQPPMPKLYPGEMTQADLRDVSAYVESL